MTVEELIEKLKVCNPKAVVSWDSHGTDTWFGETVDQFAPEDADNIDFEEDPPSWWPKGTVQIVTLS